MTRDVETLSVDNARVHLVTYEHEFVCNFLIRFFVVHRTTLCVIFHPESDGNDEMTRGDERKATISCTCWRRCC